MTSKTKLLLTFNNERRKITFPELPEKIAVSSASGNESVNVYGVGEVTVFQDKAADIYTFSCCFPAESCDAYAYVNMIEEGKEKKKPAHFISTNPPINKYCTVERFDYEERGGDVKSIWYTLELKEYRQPRSRRVVVSTKAKGAYVSKVTERVDNRETASTYTIKAGDCLWNIAKAQLGNALRWKEIATLNSLKSPYLILPGQVIRLPG